VFLCQTVGLVSWLWNCLHDVSYDTLAYISLPWHRYIDYSGWLVLNREELLAVAHATWQPTETDNIRRNDMMSVLGWPGWW